jgi:hypothetical protein
LLARSPRAACLDGASETLQTERAFDLVVNSPVLERNEMHPLHVSWAFTRLKPLVAPNGSIVFLQTQTGRHEFVADYARLVGLESVRDAGVFTVTMGKLSEIASWQRMRGQLPQLTGIQADAKGFLGLYDQLFAPLLADRAGTFRHMLSAVLERPGPYLIVETGTSRPSGDFASNGNSTLVFDTLVSLLGGRVVSIDINPTNAAYCSRLTTARCEVITSDSVKALSALSEVKEASLLYLDSFDFDGNDPHPSSIHHMHELTACWGLVKSGTLLGIDDCFGPNSGKHVYASRFLATLNVQPLFMGRQSAWQLP